jgi:aspartyl-tRNA(Asn)/glutamyl-tRNA(Gln) amidotransferase subunit B
MATWKKGNLRADVNVSVCRGGYDHYKATGSFEKLGTRCEIKNVNSFRFIQMAIEYEARRQIDILEDGGKIDQETRLYERGQGRDALHALEGRCARLSLLPRSRSSAARTLGRVRSISIKASLPELPDQKRARFVKDYGLKEYDAGVLAGDAKKPHTSKPSPRAGTRACRQLWGMEHPEFVGRPKIFAADFNQR